MSDEERRAKDRESSRAYRAANADKVRAAATARRAAWTPSERAERNAYLSRYNRANRDKMLTTKYGISVERFNEMLVSQDSSCDICGTKEPGGKAQFFHVDHCHASGRVRALLCNACNVGLGHFNDDPERLLKAASYIKHHAEAQ